jgi:SAM-dependent methyltransferase
MSPSTPPPAPRPIPRPLKRLYHRVFKRPTRARVESNAWLARHAADVTGAVLSIGSGHDRDKVGGRYRDYFPLADSYTTSEVSAEFGCDLVLDVRAMPELGDGAFDCVYCSGVLEHVDDFQASLREITRVLKPGGVLLLGLPFRQAIHGAPYDFWRFTVHGIQFLLRDDYDVVALDGIDASVPNFPASYWVKAVRLQVRG